MEVLPWAHLEGMRGVDVTPQGSPSGLLSNNLRQARPPSSLTLVKYPSPVFALWPLWCPQGGGISPSTRMKGCLVSVVWLTHGSPFRNRARETARALKTALSPTAGMLCLFWSNRVCRKLFLLPPHPRSHCYGIAQTAGFVARGNLFKMQRTPDCAACPLE